MPVTAIPTVDSLPVPWFRRCYCFPGSGSGGGGGGGGSSSRERSGWGRKETRKRVSTGDSA